MVIRFAIIVLWFIFINPISLRSQDQLFTIGGTVIDKDTGEPLVGAEVYIHELVRGTITDLEGNFKFSKLKSAKYNLHITYVGYHSLYQFVDLTSNIDTFTFLMHPSSLELMEIVIEGDPFKTGPVERSLTIESITGEFIQKNPGGTFMASLMKLPGINTIATGTSISKPVIRGLSFNRVIVTDRGIKQEGQQWGADHGLEIDQFDPEQVEIVKGPASLQYGSDGLGGIIVINNPYLAEEGSLEGQLVGIYKTNNHLLGTSAMLKGNTKGVVYQFRFSTQDFGDYSVPADNFTYNGYVLPIYNNRLKNTAGRERDLTAMLGIKRDWGYSTITLTSYNQLAGLFPGAVGIPRLYNLQDDGDPRNIDLPRQQINHLKVISNSNILINQNWLEINLGYQQNNRKEEGDPHTHGYQPTPEGNLALGLNLDTYSANILYNQTISINAKRVYGIQYQYQQNKFKGFEFLLPAFTSHDVGGFIREQRNLGDIWSYNYGLRFDYANRFIQEHYEPDFSTEDPLDSLIRNPEIDRNFYNFSGGAGLSYYPNHNTNVKINLGSSFRIPSSSELSANGVHHGTFRHERGDPNLNSERGWQVDLNYSYHKNNFYISLSPYFSYYDNFIYLRPTSEFSDLPGGGQIFQYTQDEAIYWGSELALDYHFIKNFHLEISAEYVWNYNIDTRLPLPFTPPFSTLAEIEYRIPMVSTFLQNVFFNFGTRITAAQNRVDRNENTTNGYVLLHLGIGTEFLIKKQRVEFLFNIQNLADTYYMNHLSRYRWLNLPEQGRNINFSLIFPFKIK